MRYWRILKGEMFQNILYSLSHMGQGSLTDQLIGSCVGIFASPV